MDLPPISWRTSSYSGNNGGDCIEAATTGGSAERARFLLRDSKHPQAARLSCPRGEWHAFISGIKNGEFDR